MNERAPAPEKTVRLTHEVKYEEMLRVHGSPCAEFDGAGAATSITRPLERYLKIGSGVPGLLHRRRYLCGDILRRFSYFLERADLDLPHALTRHVEFFRELLKR